MIQEFDDFFKASKKFNIIELDVPDYVEFINQWKEFVYPKGHVIFDKTICGCGFTEYCLSNEYPTILCSPRKILLENKIKQHKISGDINIYYFKNEKDESTNYDTDIDGLSKEKVQKIDGDIGDAVDQKTKEDYIVKLKVALSNWLKNCPANNPKILVTYDSLRHIFDTLGDEIQKFNIVIDEFQSIFTDTAFKADTELNFVQLLKKHRNLNVLYLSATPMLERYLGIIKYFNELPFYKLKWPNNRVNIINIDREFTPSINTSCSKLIQEYKAGIFPKKILPDKSVHESKEIVFFVNSVKTICDLIRKNNLTPEECNIICSQTAYNKGRIKKLGKGFDYGEVPTKDESNKMFTFCTRTAYLGADFYSDCAYTVICSNINIKTLIVDISLDLPQIVGRQRLDSNVFKNDVKIFYTGKTKKKSDVSLAEFIYNEMEKERKTRVQLDAYNKMEDYEKLIYSEKFIDFIRSYSYTKDYVGVDASTGFATYNYLAKISSLRSYEISRSDYQERVLIKRDLDINDNLLIEDNKYDKNSLNEFIEKFKSEFRLDDNFERRMKLYYELRTTYKEIYEQNSIIFNSFIPISFQSYMNAIGEERIKACSFKESEIRRETESIINLDKLKPELLIKFQIGQRYTLKKIKAEIKEIYDRLNITTTPKASVLNDYFELKDCKIYDSVTKKWDRGFEILKTK